MVVRKSYSNHLKKNTQLKFDFFLQFYATFSSLLFNSGAIAFKSGCLQYDPNKVDNRATPYPVARSP